MHSHKTLVVGIAIAVLLAFGSAIPSSGQVNAGGSPDNTPMLSCSPAPCVFSPKMVSHGGYPVYSNIIAANPENPSELIVAATDPNCKSNGGIFSTEDAGKTWSPTCLPPLANSLGGERPLLAYGINGTAYAGTDPERGLSAEVAVSSSNDNGKTWTRPNRAMSGDYVYAMQLAVDNSPQSTFQNTVYLAGGVLFRSSIIVSHSNDGAKTWTTSIIDRQRGKLIDYYPSLATAADGTVYATWLLCKEKPFGESDVCGGQVADIRFSKSADGGNSWSTPVAIAHPRLGPASEAWIWGVLPMTGNPTSEIPVVAVDNSNGPNAGNVYVSYYHNEGHFLQVHVITSRDGGQTWSAPARVSKATSGDEFFPWISVSDDGTVGATWLDSLHGGADRYQPYFAISTDGGLTFTGNRPLAAGLSNPAKALNMGYFGDFRTHVWVGNALYAVWMDNHNSADGTFQVAIGGVQF